MATRSGPFELAGDCHRVISSRDAPFRKRLGAFSFVLTDNPSPT